MGGTYVAIEDERNGVIPIQVVDQIVCRFGRVERVRSSIWFVARVPQQKTRAVLDHVDLLCYRCRVHVRAGNLSYTKKKK